MKTMAFIMIALTVLAYGVATATFFSVNAAPVLAGDCDGMGQPPCQEWCQNHPLDPQCRET